MLIEGFCKPVGYINYPDSRFAFSRFHFLKDGNNYLLGGPDFETLMPKIPNVDKTYYVDFTNGNDSAAGTTLGTALKSLDVALAKSDVDVVLVTAGGSVDITRNYGWSGTSPTRNVTVKSLDENLILTAAERINQIWEDTATSYVKKTTAATLAASVTGVIDKSSISNGDYLQYSKVADAVTVVATAGSWCLQSGFIYVHCFDGRNPDNNLRLFITGNNGYVTGNITVYVEGITFEGGSSPFTVENTSGNAATAPKVIFNNCKFKYGDAGNGGLSVTGANEIYLKNCLAAKNYNDGFNYHSRDNIITKILEVSCVGRNNGVIDGTDNGSTIHNGITIVRLNGEYYANRGANIMDVNAGSISWNLGCSSRNAAEQSDRPELHANWVSGLDADGAVKMWLDGCQTSGTDTDIMVANQSKMYVRDTAYLVKTGTGPLETY